MTNNSVEMTDKAAAKYLNEWLFLNRETGHARGVSIEHALRTLVRQRNGRLVICATRHGIFKEFVEPAAPVTEPAINRE